MSTTVRKIDQPAPKLRNDWAVAQADAIETTVLEIDDKLAGITVLEAIFIHDAEVSRDARALHALVKSRRNDMADEAGRLREGLK